MKEAEGVLMDCLPNLAPVLYYGDNLYILRTHLADESVDLIYLDPPFYSRRNYQALFRKTLPEVNSQARVPAFGDTWRWDTETEQAYTEVLAGSPEPVVRALVALRYLLGQGSLLAYLVMMAQRLVEFCRVLKPTGSVYLHCDPSASHYLKLLLDAVFGPENFRNEIVWSYKTGGASRRHFARKHDLIFFYSKSDRYIFHVLKERSYMMHRYGFKKSEFLRDERGEYTWVYMKDVWDLPALGAADGKRLGYPTQKPEVLLERIILASSNKGDIVLDPFSGSGTTLAVAQRLERKWIGIEAHALALVYQRSRLFSTFPDLHYTFSGGPATLAEARRLAQVDAAQFRWWVLALNYHPLTFALSLPVTVQIFLVMRPCKRWCCKSGKRRQALLKNL
ncbi:MAG TPA: site-specific DNA-methyltransferase [Ktedonobacteraceae bacterium]|nr:site-specific DNA-methyltransferase [Ktedonobacteraceae bacterium]